MHFATVSERVLNSIGNNSVNASLLNVKKKPHFSFFMLLILQYDVEDAILFLNTSPCLDYSAINRIIKSSLNLWSDHEKYCCYITSNIKKKLNERSISYNENKNIINSLQSEFRTNLSAAKTVWTLTENPVKGLDKGLNLYRTLCDLSKAFS